MTTENKAYEQLLEKLHKDVIDPLKKDVDDKYSKQLDDQAKEIANLKAQNRTFVTGMGGGDTTKTKAFADFCVDRRGKELSDPLSPSKSFLGGWAKAVWMYEHGQGDRIPSEVSKAMGEAAGSTGGFFLPIEFKPELLKLVIENQVVRPRAFTLPMATETAWIPRIVDTTHVTTIHGGVAGAWQAEAANLTASTDPAAGRVQLTAKKFSDYRLVSNELIMDSPISIPSLLGMLMREGLGFFEDVSAIWGNGAGQMQGFMNSGALVSVTRSKASHITYPDIVAMFSRMFPSSLNRAVWVCSPSCFVDLAQMSVAVGTGGSAVWISNYNTAVGAPPATIFGRPVVISEKMSELGALGDIAFADFSYYIIGDRMEIALATSEHVAFATDQTAFRVIERLDGQSWLNSALTPNRQTTTLSPFVALAA